MIILTIDNRVFESQILFKISPVLTLSWYDNVSFNI